ncbi:unnamed protein product, partial [Phaeothamnion confervicola]
EEPIKRGTSTSMLRICQLCSARANRELRCVIFHPVSFAPDAGVSRLQTPQHTSIRRRSFQSESSENFYTVAFSVSLKLVHFCVLPRSSAKTRARLPKTAHSFLTTAQFHCRTGQAGKPGRGSSATWASNEACRG